MKTKQVAAPARKESQLQLTSDLVDPGTGTPTQHGQPAHMQHSASLVVHHACRAPCALHARHGAPGRDRVIQRFHLWWLLHPGFLLQLLPLPRRGLRLPLPTANQTEQSRGEHARGAPCFTVWI